METLLGLFSGALEAPLSESGSAVAAASPLPQTRGRLAAAAGGGTGRPTTLSPVRLAVRPGRSPGGAQNGRRASTQALQTRRGSVSSTSPVRGDKEQRRRHSSVSPTRAAQPPDKVLWSLEDLDARAGSPTSQACLSSLPRLSTADRHKPGSTSKPLASCDTGMRPGYRDPQVDKDLRFVWQQNLQSGWW